LNDRPRVENTPRIELNDTVVSETIANTDPVDILTETSIPTIDIQTETSKIESLEPSRPSRDRIGHVRSYSQGKVSTGTF